MTTGRINQVAVRTGRGHEGASPTWPLQSIETALPSSVYLQFTHNGRKTLQGTQVPETTDSFPIRINIFFLCREKRSHGQRNRSRNKTGERIGP